MQGAFVTDNQEFVQIEVVWVIMKQVSDRKSTPQ